MNIRHRRCLHSTIIHKYKDGSAIFEKTIALNFSIWKDVRAFVFTKNKHFRCGEKKRCAVTEDRHAIKCNKKPVKYKQQISYLFNYILPRDETEYTSIVRNCGPSSDRHVRGTLYYTSVHRHMRARQQQN